MSQPCPACSNSRRILVERRATGNTYVDCGTCDQPAGWRLSLARARVLRDQAVERFSKRGA